MQNGQMTEKIFIEKAATFASMCFHKPWRKNVCTYHWGWENLFKLIFKKNLLHKCCFKFYQDTSFLSCTWFQCGNCSTSFNVGLEWCSSQYAAYAETEQIFANICSQYAAYAGTEQIFAQGEGDWSCNRKDLDRSLEGNLSRRWMFGVTLIRICPPNA